MADHSETTDPPADAGPDAERYRTAAEAALDQLDWCIAYFHRIRKSPVATALARNQAQIRKELT